MITATRILGFICMWAACDRTFPPAEVPINRPETSKPPEIQTTTGRIAGYYMNTLTGNVIGAYEGIPYAESPVGKLRFREPVPKTPWSGTLVADKRVSCIQMDPTRYYRVIGKEDCLLLNVYIPLNRQGGDLGNLPVIAWIHGGSWHWGSGTHFGPVYLLDYPVILVTLNYRLGPLGFLSISDSESSIPGNLGLKDQALALQWITENIGRFGGNPRQVTLAGHSAGAASVHLHMMSPISQGKFQRAISLSGNAFGFWALPPNQTLLVERFTKSLGCYRGRRLSIADCLRRRSARRIVSKQYDLYEVLENPSILFGPVVETGNPSGFLLESPAELYRKGKVANIPWMTGILRDEGDLYTLANYATPLAIRRIVRDLDTNIPIILAYNRSRDATTNAIKSFYFGDSPKFSFSGFEALKSIGQLIGDRYFYVPFHKAIETHSRLIGAPLYAYYFTYDGKHSVAEKLYLPPDEWGVMHMDELQYLFNSSEYYPALKTTDRDYILSKYFTDLVTNFATLGEPVIIDSPEHGAHHGWEPYTPFNPELLEINFNTGMRKEPNPHHLQFWDSIRNEIEGSHFDEIPN